MEVIPETVYLESLSFQRTSSTTGLGTATAAYVHIYDSFVVNDSGVLFEIGNLVAVSSSTVDFAGASANQTLTWNFAQNAISSTTQYVYVFATGTTAATLANSSNLTTGAFELRTGNPYAGGRAYAASAANPDAAGWDLEFSMVTSTVPEPSAFLLGAIGTLALFRRRR